MAGRPASDIPSSIRTIPSVPESHRFSPPQGGVADYTAGRDFHPALKRYVSAAKIAIIYINPMMFSLFLFLVGDYGDDVDEDGKDGEHDIVERQILELAALEADGAEDIDKICRRQEIRTKKSIRNTACSKVSE